MKPPGQLHRSSSLRSGSLSRKPGNGASSRNRLERCQSERKPRKAMKRSPLNKVSKRRAPRIRAERQAWDEESDRAFKEAGGRCVFVDENGNRCPKRARHRHHKLARSQGGNRRPKCKPLCSDHHGWCHLHPKEAVRRGYVQRRSDWDPVQQTTTRKLGRAA